MMPRPRHLITVKTEIPQSWSVHFAAVPEVVEAVRAAPFTQSLTYSELDREWWLHVDPLYDFNEVVVWLKAQDRITGNEPQLRGAKVEGDAGA